MSRPKLTESIRAVLAALSTGEYIDSQTIADRINAEGGDADARRVYSHAWERSKAGEFLKLKRGGLNVFALNPHYAAPLRGGAAQKAKREAAEGSVAATSALPVSHAATLGQKVTRPAPVAETTNRLPPLDFDVDYAVRDLFDARLSDDQAYTATDVARELGGKWSLGEVRIALYEGVQQGWLHMEHSAEDNDNVFQRATVVADPAPVPPAAEPAVVIPGIGDVEPLTQAPSLLQPLALRDRLAAIACDLEDAIGDACDNAMPHPVIKALVCASGATNRALRDLAA